MEPVNGIKGDVENIIDGRFNGWWTIEHDKKESFEWKKRMVKSYNSICLGKKYQKRLLGPLCVIRLIPRDGCFSLPDAWREDGGPVGLWFL